MPPAAIIANGPVRIRFVGPVIECGLGWRALISVFMREKNAIHPELGAVTFRSSALTGQIDITIHDAVPDDVAVLSNIISLIVRTERLSKLFCESCGTMREVSTTQQPHAMVMATRCQDCLRSEQSD